MMHNWKIIVYFCFIHSLVLAQKQDYIWHIGKDQSLDPGVQGMQMDWNSGKLEVKGIDLALGVDNNNTSICDEEGNLLFWSNGCAVMNRYQEVMPHGDTLNWDQEYHDIIGWPCERGYPMVQSIHILPDPAYDHGYYIVHKARTYELFEEVKTELRCSYVDMLLDEGKGDVVYFDSLLYNEAVPTISHLTAIPHSNGADWWILQPLRDTDRYLTYKIDETGIHRMPDQEAGFVFQRKRIASGTSRFSPDGNHLAFYCYLSDLHLMDFDRSTGKVSNHRKVNVFDTEHLPTTSYRFGSVEWSPSSRYIYLTNRDSLMQVDTWSSDMESSAQLIDVWDGTNNPFPTTFYVMTLAPDCKIYMCSTNGNQSYHIIHHPDAGGQSCDFEQNGLQLPQPAGIGNLPFHPRFRVDEESKCDSTITSVLRAEVYYRHDMHVYPNPCLRELHLSVPQSITDGTLLVYDQQGRLVHEARGLDIGETYTMAVTSWPSGLYYAEIYSNTGQRMYYGATFKKE